VFPCHFLLFAGQVRIKIFKFVPRTIYSIFPKFLIQIPLCFSISNFGFLFYVRSQVSLSSIQFLFQLGRAAFSSLYPFYQFFVGRVHSHFSLFLVIFGLKFTLILYLFSEAHFPIFFESELTYSASFIFNTFFPSIYTAEILFSISFSLFLNSYSFFWTRD